MTKSHQHPQPADGFQSDVDAVKSRRDHNWRRVVQLLPWVHDVDQEELHEDVTENPEDDMAESLLVQEEAHEDEVDRNYD